MGAAYETNLTEKKGGHMKKLFQLLALSLLVAVSSSAFAAAAGYGSAGCGFGGMLIKENKKLHQIGAWFLNGISGNQTFAITSGTSDCKTQKLAIIEKEQQHFVTNNYGNLVKEMAVGEGENLDALAYLLGCPEEQTKDLGVFAQKNYTSLFGAEEMTPTEMLTALKKGLSDDPRLGPSCHKI
jgi:hypothetical protein